MLSSEHHPREGNFVLRKQQQFWKLRFRIESLSGVGRKRGEIMVVASCEAPASICFPSLSPDLHTWAQLPAMSLELKARVAIELTGTPPTYPSCGKTLTAAQGEAQPTCPSQQRKLGMELSC